MDRVKRLRQTLESFGIYNKDVLNAFEKVPRERFVLPEDEPYSYENIPLPIGHEQTISQPYIIALMTQALLERQARERVLEVGTGSGYQAAILAQCIPQVYTIERIESLYKKTKKLFEDLNYTNIHTKYGDGYQGWEEHAPFDGILITAAPEQVPPALLKQLNPLGGRMIIPVGETYSQTLRAIDRNQDHYKETILEAVRFVPLKPGTE